MMKRILIFILVVFSTAWSAQRYSALADEIRKYDTRAIDAYMQGMAYEAAGELEDALEAYRRAASFDPSSPDIFYAMARLLLQLQQEDEGREALKKLIQLEPTHMEGLQLLGEIARAHGHLPEAMGYFHRILELDDRSEYALIQLADTYQALGDSLQEADYLVKLWEVNNDRLNALRRAEMILLNAKQYDRIIELYDKLIKRMPDNVELVDRQIRLYLGMNRFFDAEALMESLIAVTPWSLDFHGMKTDLVKAMHGEIAAIDYLKKVVLDYPDAWQLQLKLGQLLIDAGESINARNVIKDLLIARPDISNAVSMLVFTYLDVDDLDGALQVLRDYIPAFPENFFLHRLMGSILHDLAIRDQDSTLFEQALAIQRRALVLNPEDQQTLHLLANTLEQYGAIGEVMTVYEHLLELYPRDDLALNNYAYMLAEQSSDEGVLREAGDMVERALSINPQSAPYLDTAGWIYFKLGHIQLAREFIQRSLEIEPDNVEVLRHMGQILEFMGKSNEAYVYYLRADKLE